MEISKTSLKTKEVAEEVVKAKRKRPDRSVAMSDQIESGDNRKYLQHSRLVAELPDIDITNNAQVQMRIDEYMDLCLADDMKPTCAGLALAFGVDRTQMWRYVNGMVKSLPPSVVNTLKKAYTVINSQMEDYMQNGKINPVAGIFLMKNNMGYTDKTEVIVAPGNAEPEAMELLEQAELLPED